MEVLTHGVTHVLKPDYLDCWFGLAVFITLLVLAGPILQVMAVPETREGFRLPVNWSTLVATGCISTARWGRASGSDGLRVSGSSLSWTFVQPEVQGSPTHAAMIARALGWSDAGPMPRSSRQIVKDSAHCCSMARVEGPFVLVGHSFGTFTYASMRAPIGRRCGHGAR